jgi:hypothetical protein
VKDGDGGLLPSAMPRISFFKYSRFTPTATDADGVTDPSEEVEILARITAKLD